ncbi:hypothetical protein BKA66DRAFT_397183, partial [Pyrenochaeta sp. MPI-SDFR-AT-0127]
NVTDAFWSLLGPWHFMLISLSYLPGTILRVYKNLGFRALFPWNNLQSAWFSSFWAWAGPRIREGNGPRITALLEGRVSQARVSEDVVMEPISGIVMDIGPGLGYWVDLYGKADVPVAKDGTESREIQKGIKKVYGVEPSLESHPSLRQRVKEAGLDGVYEILPVGIEAISKVSLDGTTTIEKGTVDCIVSLLCLCSIPEPEKNTKELYEYLKKGGRWYLYEHVVVKANWPMRMYQAIVNLFWPHALGGCQLCRDTGKTLRQAGPWARIDLAQPPEEPWHQTVPHIFGTLTK